MPARDPATVWRPRGRGRAEMARKIKSLSGPNLTHCDGNPGCQEWRAKLSPCRFPGLLPVLMVAHCRVGSRVAPSWYTPALLLLIATLAGCKPAAATKSSPPVVVAQEDKLIVVELTADAEQNLRIATTRVRTETVDRYRGYGAELVVPTGASIAVSAPVGGTLQTPPSGVPKVGTVVQAGQAVFLLMPLTAHERSVLSPAERIRYAEARNTIATARIDADGQWQQAQVQVDAMRIALERAQRLLREQAGTARAVDDAQAQYDLALKALEAAKARKKLIDNLQLDEEGVPLKPLTITAPQPGTIRAAPAAAGEVVSPQQPLFEVARFDPLWARVPVYVGELNDLAPNAPARIAQLGRAADKEFTVAGPVVAPPTATPLASTADLYFELPNPQGRYRPGERVAAHLRQQGESQALTLPWSAVIHDYHGGTWVYERTAPHRYVRRGVEVRYVREGDVAVLEQGPGEGAEVVTAGAVELFGIEFGFAR